AALVVTPATAPTVMGVRAATAGDAARNPRMAANYLSAADLASSYTSASLSDTPSVMYALALPYWPPWTAAGAPHASPRAHVHRLHASTRPPAARERQPGGQGKGGRSGFGRAAEQRGVGCVGGGEVELRSDQLHVDARCQRGRRRDLRLGGHAGAEVVRRVDHVEDHFGRGHDLV